MIRVGKAERPSTVPLASTPWTGSPRNGWRPSAAWAQVRALRHPGGKDTVPLLPGKFNTFNTFIRVHGITAHVPLPKSRE